MKAIGMCLIVYGHIAHATTVGLTPPVYLKQFGVAFFLFSTGFTLAREHRNAVEVLFRRLFPVYFFGLSLAVLITVTGAIKGSGLALSNFLPFAAGANVLFNTFPANPTTWYLGTYIHFLLLWAWPLRRIRVRGWMIALAVVMEIPIRALLIAFAGPYVAYMLLVNWTAVFLLGMAKGAGDERDATDSPIPYAAALALGLVAWAVMGPSGFSPTFPFMTLSRWPPAFGLAAVSMAVSMLYLSTTWLVFEVTRRVAAPAAVRFVARNSLIIFLVHMPLFFALHPILVRWGLSYWARVGVQGLVCLVGLAVVSEAIHAAIDMERLRSRAFEMLAGTRKGPQPTTVRLAS
jgi:peptidoglycan/LPS O-acetylase OafA/YrhL